MLTKEQNELLTRVEGDAPMGLLMRENYWFPFALSSQVAAGDAPFMVRLLGCNYIALRASDGRIGFFDENCPHRGASLALARVEDGDLLRCIFHAWQFDIEGNATDCPTEPPDRAEAFCARVKLTRYPVHEAGGLIWVWLGSGEAPSFPNLPFAGTLEENTFLTVTTGQCNWLQGVEGTLDSAHIGTLHKTWISGISDRNKGNIGMSLDGPPQYDSDLTDYGLRAAALRTLAGGNTYARITEYLMPFVCLAPSNETRGREGVIFIISPVDDEHHLMFFGLYSDREKQDPVAAAIQPEGGQCQPFNYAPLPGGRENRWGQDRALMKSGHFTGFGNNILEEDMVVQASMGPIVDRTREFLSATDIAIVNTRRMLLGALEGVERGDLPPGSARRAEAVVLPSPVDTVLGPDRSWKNSASEPAPA
jgi:phenylpropionate dioxygenase-like ring-hydroxylating dioxygenase large terminal subunit